MHLVIDGFGGSEAKLQDLLLVYQTLDELPARIGMTKIMPPYVFKYCGVKPEDWGISGFVLIAESHISVHTFPRRAYVNVDIFSCKFFDAAPAVAHIQEIFQLAGVKVDVLERGLEYPTALPKEGLASKMVRLEPFLQEGRKAPLSGRG